MRKTLKKIAGLTVASLSLGAALSLNDAVKTVSAEDNVLVVYSNSLSNGRGDWLKEQAKEAGFELEFVEAGGGDIYNRLLAEKDAPQADVAFGMDETFFLNLESEGILKSYKPAWAEGIEESSIFTNEESFYPIVQQQIFAMYNPEYIDEEEAPKEWEDLANNFAGKYRAPAKTGGNTNQKAILSILLQYQDEEGEYGISDEGWAAVEAFLNNAYEIPEDGDSLQLFADGEMPINFYYSSGQPEAEETYGFKATPIVPEAGIITLNEQVAVINKGDDADYSKAEEFVEWFGSPEVQNGWAKEFNTIPVHPDGREGLNERSLELAEQLQPAMEVDWNFINENIDSWLEKIELELMP